MGGVHFIISWFLGHLGNHLLIESILSTGGFLYYRDIEKSLIYKGISCYYASKMRFIFRLKTAEYCSEKQPVCIGLKTPFQIVWHYPKGVHCSVISLTIEDYQGETSAATPPSRKPILTFRSLLSVALHSTVIRLPVRAHQFSGNNSVRFSAV